MNGKIRGLKPDYIMYDELSKDVVIVCYRCKSEECKCSPIKARMFETFDNIDLSKFPKKELR